MTSAFKRLTRSQKLRFLLIAPLHIPTAFFIAVAWHSFEWLATQYTEHVGPAFRRFVFWGAD